MNLKALLIVIGVAITTSCLAIPVNTGLIYSKSDFLKESLEKTLTFPEKAVERHLDGIVVVDFTLMPSGKARINAINYSDPEFKAQVIRKLNNLNKTADEKLIGKSFIYKFVFILK